MPDTVPRVTVPSCHRRSIASVASTTSSTQKNSRIRTSSLGYLRPYQLAARLQIQPYWIYDRIRNGTIKIKKHAQYNAFLFPDVPQTLEKLRQLLNGQVKIISF